MDQHNEQTRLYYLDWLRVLTIGVVFLYHCGRPFGRQAWQIANATSSLTASLYVEFLRIWMMPLFFVLSGAAIVFSMRRRSVPKLIGERVLRLLVPLVGVGWFVAGPIQIYFERLTYGQFSGTFFQFLPHYLHGFAQFGGNFAWHGMNLWFLLYLFLLTLLWLPWFVPFGRSQRSVLARIAPALGNIWTLLALTIPVAAADHLVSALDMEFLRGTGGWSFFTYFLLLPMGYMLFNCKKALEIIRRIAWPALGAAVSLSALYVTFVQGVQVEISYGSLLYYGLTFARSAAALMWIYALMGLCSRYLNFTNGFLKRASEGSLPFYIVHQTFIVLLGYYIIQWDIAIGAKALLIVLTAGTATLLTYWLVIRRFNPVRFLLGMRLNKREKASR